MRMGSKDSLDLDVEAASGPASAAVEAAGSSGPEDLLLLLRQADELHRGSEQNKREGFQLLLNNKLAVRPKCLSLPSLPPSQGMKPTNQPKNKETHVVSNPAKPHGKGDRVLSLPNSSLPLRKGYGFLPPVEL